MPHSPANLVAIDHVAVLVVVDNTTVRSDLAAEHGLALWVEAGGHRLLLDTGQGGAIRANAPRLGVPLETAEAVERYGVQVLAPAHCTGEAAVRYLAEHFPDACVGCGAGTWFALA